MFLHDSLRCFSTQQPAEPMDHIGLRGSKNWNLHNNLVPTQQISIPMGMFNNLHLGISKENHHL